MVGVTIMSSMAVGIVFMIIMVVIAMFIIPFFILFFTDFVGFVPRCLDKYFERRVQVYDNDEEDKRKNSKYDQESNLYRYNRKPSNNR